MELSRHIIGLVLFVGVCLAVGFIASTWSPGEWYQTINKPSWTPPNWVFGPVWTLLYIMMGVAAWLVWREFGFSGAKVALGVFFVQLALNFLWSYLFFGIRSPAAAFIDLAFLWIAILVTIVLFWSRNTVAGALLLPYIAWVTYAGSLNLGIWVMD